MKKLFNLAVAIMNYCHDGIANLANSLGFNLNDKALHFIVIGAIGIIIYACIYALLKFMAKRNINVIASVCSFVIVVVLASAIEILQGVTGSGCMEFADAAYGVYGFASALTVCFLAKKAYVAVKEFMADSFTVTGEMTSD